MSRSRRKSRIIRAGVDLISRAIIEELSTSLSYKEYDTQPHDTQPYDTQPYDTQPYDTRPRKRVCRNKRRWWVKPPEISSTVLKERVAENTEEYRTHLCMNESQFEYLLEKVTPLIKKRDTWFREAVNPKIKLQVTLRYLATGDSMSSLSALYRVPRSTLSLFFPRVCEAIYNALEDFITVPNTAESWENVMRDYETLWNFPNVCGVVDGKHVNIKCPPSTGSKYFNSKTAFRTTLFAIVDANYNFLYIDVGTSGGVNEAPVLAESTFNAALQNNSLNIPEQGVFIVDDASSLKTNVLKPFPECAPLNEKQKVFNYRLSRTRRVVENTFGILASKFRVFENPIPLSVDTTEQMVKATCALHNWLNETSTLEHPYIQKDTLDVEDWDEGRVVPGTATQHPHAGLEEIPGNAETKYNVAAEDVRECYAERFVTTDVVPWQWKMI